MKKRLYTLTGCITGLYLIIGFVFYIILVINTLTHVSVDWLKIFFLFYGLGAFIFVLPLWGKSFFMLGCECERDKCDYEDIDD